MRVDRSGGAETQWWSGGVDAFVGVDDGEGPVGFEGETPPAFVCTVMMLAAQGKEVVEIGRATVFPVVHMVRFGVGERHSTAWDGTRRVHRP